MIVGVPREIKPDEYRVAMLPSGVDELKRHGHRVLIERGAGMGSGMTDEQYSANGAEIVDGPDPIFGQAELVVKVKEPLAAEWPLLRPGQILFTYFHFAASEELTRNVLATGITAVAYETLRGPRGDLWPESPVWLRRTF
ncbi:MAG: alanine dehydrogenase [Planctomycetota bacterium]|nr:MAG: alanine dehydrogenase [Planctomycetota bacterium]